MVVLGGRKRPSRSLSRTLALSLSLACLLARSHARVWSLLFIVKGFLSAQIGVLERVGYHRAPVLGLGWSSGCRGSGVEAPEREHRRVQLGDAARGVGRVDLSDVPVGFAGEELESAIGGDERRRLVCEVEELCKDRAGGRRAERSQRRPAPRHG